LLLQAVRDSEWEGREIARMRNGQEQVISLVTPYYDTCSVQVSMRWCSRTAGWTYKQWDMVLACLVGTMQWHVLFTLVVFNLRHVAMLVLSARLAVARCLVRDQPSVPSTHIMTLHHVLALEYFT
jgi:hypothetical protein